MNQILTPQMITNEAMMIIENNLTFAKGVNRQYDKRFAIEGAKIGNTVNARKPARYVGTTGQALNVEDHTETSVPVSLTTQFHVDVQFSSADLTLSLQDFSERILKPAIATIANKVDRDGLLMAYQATFAAVGTPGTTPNALLTYLQAGAKLDYMGAPRDGLRSAVLEPTAQATIVDALKGVFQDASSIAQQYKTGTMGKVGGLKFSMDQNVISHKVGPLGGTPVVNGAGQTGTSLVTSGWTAAAANRLKKGDVFTVASVNAVNPQTRASTGQLAQFVALADVASDGTGAATIPIYPPITVAGAFATVDSTPANSAALTVLGAASTVTPANLVYHRDAFTLVCADLEMPKGVDFAARAQDEQLGVSVRCVRQYDIRTDLFPCRFDILYGWAPLYPEFSCRVQG